ALEKGRKTGIGQSEITKGFWPPLGTDQNPVSGRPVCPRFHPRPADHSLADSSPSRICHPAGLDDRFASEGNRLGCYPAGATGDVAGGGAPPGHRRGAGMAAGSLGEIVYRPASYPPGNGSSVGGSRVLVRRHITVVNLWTSYAWSAR